MNGIKILIVARDYVDDCTHTLELNLNENGQYGF